MAHPKELLDKVEVHLRLKYWSDPSILREKRFKGNIASTLCPDLQVIVKGVAVCVVEVGDNDADKLDFYLKQKIPDIRWYSKKTGELVARFDGRRSIKGDNRLFIPPEMAIVDIKKILRNIDSYVECLWKKREMRDAEDDGYVWWIGRNLLTDQKTYYRHTLHIYPYADPDIYRVSLDYTDHQGVYPEKWIKKSMRSCYKYELTCRAYELHHAVDWVLLLYNWFDRHTEEEIRQWLLLRDRKRLPFDLNKCLKLHFEGHWNPLDYGWTEAAWEVYPHKEAPRRNRKIREPIAQ